MNTDDEKIINGAYNVGPRAKAILVESESKLTELSWNCYPGTIAFTAGYEKVWQLDVDGTTWVNMIGGE